MLDREHELDIYGYLWIALLKLPPISHRCKVKLIRIQCIDICVRKIECYLNWVSIYCYLNISIHTLLLAIVTVQCIGTCARQSVLQMSINHTLTAAMHTLLLAIVRLDCSMLDRMLSKSDIYGLYSNQCHPCLVANNNQSTVNRYL